MLLHNGFNLLAFTGSNYLLIESLVDESKQEGFEFVQRTIDGWNSGANRFSETGEGLWGLVFGTELIGIGGLNIDPYVEDASTGRVRHLYIRRDYRRKGCATLLMNKIIEQAQLHFQILRLFTVNPAAAAFYEQFGFEHLPGYKVSHVLILSNSTKNFPIRDSRSVTED
jgi:GNAT superfamily N-acetyltransferase